MSNKSRLQTNNTNLQALITKANNLPDAGGGTGGGGSVETCTVGILADVPISAASLYWADGNGTMQSQEFTGMDFMIGISLQCIKNSFIYASEMVFGNTGGSSFNNIHRIDMRCLFVTGDATYTIT